MAWSIATTGSWGIATTTAPASELAAALAKPGSFLLDQQPHSGSQRVYMRKDQWGTLTAAPLVELANPPRGTTAGGTTITIHGSGLTGSTGVNVGGGAATSFAVSADHVLTCVTPAHAAGPVNVVVLNPRGNVTLTNGFTYV